MTQRLLTKFTYRMNRFQEQEWDGWMQITSKRKFSRTKRSSIAWLRSSKTTALLASKANSSRTFWVWKWRSTASRLKCLSSAWKSATKFHGLENFHILQFTSTWKKKATKSSKSLRWSHLSFKAQKPNFSLTKSNRN